MALLAAAATPGSAAADAPSTAHDAAFLALGGRWLDATTRFGPIGATRLGVHRYDDIVDDLSPAGRAKAAKAWRLLLQELQQIPAARLSRSNRIDAILLDNRLRYDLWIEETLRSWSWDPLIYNDLAGGSLYDLIARDFAPMSQRLASATARMEALPAFLAQARRNLEPARVPQVHAETVAKQNRGIVAIVGELISPHAGELSPAARRRFEAASDGLAKAVAEHQNWIDTILIPRAQGEFRLGASLYDAKLAFALQSPLGRSEIRKRAEAAVVSTRAQMYDLARAVLASHGRRKPIAPTSPTADQQQAVIRAALDLAAADHPAAGEVVAAARAGLADATAFVRARDLVTLPAAPVQVILMPEFRRGVSVAYCDAPGPLDRAMATFYAVSPIPSDWGKERTESFLREYNRRAIHDIATHEAMPGHYVQLAHANAYPSVLRAVLASGSFIEGWAVYAESMMAQEGFMNGDSLYKLVVLKTKLRSITNALLDQAIHVDGMTRAEAMKLMMETAFQEEGEAAGKWVRASVSSAQLPSYFVGSEEHWAIRREAETRWGQAFGLKRYHDNLLAYGSPPARFVRQSLFDEPIA